MDGRVRESADLATLLALPPGSVVFCHTAPVLRRLPVPTEAAIHATVSPGHAKPRVDGLCVHQRAVPSVDVHGLPVSRPDAMLIELAEHLRLVDLVVVGDALVRHGWSRR